MSGGSGTVCSVEVDIDGAPALVYADLDAPGYGRRRHGRGFLFLTPEGERLSEPKALAHCRSLVIPPAWREVWIGQRTDGHILCTGLDGRGRKQYLYHPLWNEWRNRRKFDSLAEFASRLYRIRDAVARDHAACRTHRRRGG